MIAAVVSFNVPVELGLQERRRGVCLTPGHLFRLSLFRFEMPVDQNGRFDINANRGQHSKKPNHFIQSSMSGLMMMVMITISDGDAAAKKDATFFLI